MAEPINTTNPAARDDGRKAILIYGGRNLDWRAVAAWLNRNASKSYVKRVIQGDADGADRGGKNWAVSQAIPVSSYPADWRGNGRAAGPLRNQRMIDDGKPDAAIEFPGGRGTADMRRRLEAAAIPITFAKLDARAALAEDA